LNHEELRTQFKKQLELETVSDLDAQMRLKRQIEEQQRLADDHYHDLMMADVEARKRREETETTERNRANHVQVQALVEQIASRDDSKAARAQRIAAEHEYLVIMFRYLFHLYYELEPKKLILKNDKITRKLYEK